MCPPDLDDPHLRAAVIELLAELTGVDPARVTPQAALHGDLGVDSLALIQLGVRLEERFGVVLPNLALPTELGAETVDDLVRVLRELLRERAGGAR